MASVIKWRIADANWQNYDACATDKQNLQAALAQLGQMDTPGTRDEIDTINRQLVLPQVYDNLGESLAKRCDILCRPAEGAEALVFKGKYDPNEETAEGEVFLYCRDTRNPNSNWSLDTSNLTGIDTQRRGSVVFRFEVLFGN